MALRLYSSDTAKFLDSLDTAHMRRGRGGRSSFSGVTATVFGATGFLGKFVANRLGARGTQMIFPYRSEPWYFRDLKTCGALGQVLFSEFHLRNEESIARAVKHSDVVISLINRDFDTRNFNMYESNAEGPARLARISKTMGVKKFIHVSAMNCERSYEGYCVKGGSQYLKTKYQGELMVRDEFPEAIIIRPADMYGFADVSCKFIQQYLLHWNRMSVSTFGGTYRVPHGGYGIFKQPIYAGDVAQAITNAALDDAAVPGLTYQAVGPRRYEYRDIVDWLLRATRMAGSPDMPEVRVGDLKYQPLLLAQAWVNELTSNFQNFPKGYLTFDKIERETVSDEVDPALPLIDDLGIPQLEYLEHRGLHNAEISQRYATVNPMPDEFPEVYPAKFTEPHRPSYVA